MNKIKLQIVPMTNSQGQWFIVREEGSRRYIGVEFGPGKYAFEEATSPIKFKTFRLAVKAARHVFGVGFEIVPWEAA